MSGLFENKTLSHFYNSRPDYNDNVINTIINYWKRFNEQSCRKLSVVDVGCGTGQLTSKLLPYANKIVGIDISESQLAEAKQRNQNFIKFQLADYTSIPVPDSSVDLITAAQCIHWFDIDAFYNEVDRCLNQNGVLAVLSYGRFNLQSCYDLTNTKLIKLNEFLSNDLWYGEEYLGNYTKPEARWASSLLPNMKYCYKETSERNIDIIMPITMSISRIGDYIKSTTMYNQWKLENGDNGVDFVDRVNERIMESFDLPLSTTNLDQFELKLQFPLVINLCCKKQ